MSLPRRQLIRIAVLLRDQLLILQASRQWAVQRKLEGLLEPMDRARAVRRKLAVCQARSWQAAARDLLGQLGSCLRDVPYYLERIQQAAENDQPKVPALREIYQDLEQLEGEFGTLRYDRQGQLLVVGTDPIELEGVYLGEFEIQLHIPSLSELPQRGIYQVVALDPHPSTANAAVTHPHVSDERLCEGDAGAAIHAPLAAGRICDFFLLVRSVLTHYNPGSSYVSLDHWGGRACYDCGCLVDEDELYCCASWENEFCSECASYCPRCDQATCQGCLASCPVCGEAVCPGCMTECPDCGSRLCQTCLEESQCPCNEEKEDEPEEDRSEQTHQAGSGTEAA